MLKGPYRINQLDPTLMAASFDLTAKSEVMIRRQISAMYMAVFNFWASIELYYNGVKGSGRSGEPDDFQETEFERAMISHLSSREIMALSTFRNASDHRIENPALNIVFNGTNPHITEPSLGIDNKSLNKAYSCFLELIKSIKLAHGIS